MRCLEHMKVIEILRLKELNIFTYQQIGSSVGCSKTTVGEILKRCKECGLTYSSAKGLTQERINELIYPDSFGPKITKDEPDWEYYHRRMKSSRRINLQYLWEEEYRPSHPDGYSYSRFCFLYNKWKDQTGKKVVMPQEREPGKEMLIDWIGDTLDCVRDSATGSLLTAHFFVTTLGDSSYPFVEAFPDETQLNWLQGNIDAFNYYGGVPRILIPDNTKTAVIHRRLYDTELNHAYRDMAAHYGVAIIPARIKAPRDKPDVESGVGWLETWLLEWLKGRTYFSFAALNHDISIRVAELSERKFQKRPGTRSLVFQELDKPALRPLPKDVFEFFETKEIKSIPNNYHVEYDGFYYSVPYIYYTRSGSIHAYAKRIEVYLDSGERIAVHQRRFSGRRYKTDYGHMPENHKAVADFNRYDGNYYRKRASAYGQDVYRFIDGLLTGVPAEEQAYKSCMGVLNFCRQYGNGRVDHACRKAISLNSVTYTTLKNILKNGQDRPSAKQTPDMGILTQPHENLRTGEWR